MQIKPSCLFATMTYSTPLNVPRLCSMRSMIIDALYTPELASLAFGGTSQAESDETTPSRITRDIKNAPSRSGGDASSPDRSQASARYM